LLGKVRLWAKLHHDSRASHPLHCDSGDIPPHRSIPSCACQVADRFDRRAGQRGLRQEQDDRHLLETRLARGQKPLEQR